MHYSVDMKYDYTQLSAGEFLHDERKNLDSQYGDLTVKEMDQTMAAIAQKNKFLIDGFPRNQDNLQGWNKTVDRKADVFFILSVLNNDLRGKSSGRTDDNTESLEKKIQTYLQTTRPVIDSSEKKNEEIFDEIIKIFDKEG
ncbi:unnamed protein product [Nyctereutes procyonoides]|uniref:(raccoon dog) hypothetical protein n=1 Tax=Nyctereutes procyonoides TaxID=34880 RepID=A0A811ZE11_NYCPR|nr:unnamed protein product [Nyctereutes procyonoides]